MKGCIICKRLKEENEFCKYKDKYKNRIIIRLRNSCIKRTNEENNKYKTKLRELKIQNEPNIN